jgi:predicted SprT family Zn-dependent metalloprotease
MLTNEVKDRVLTTIEQNYLAAESHYNREFKRPTIKFAKRGRTAGTANPSTNTLNYNTILLMENQDDFVARTVPHEVAHLIDANVNPKNFERDVVRGRNGMLKVTKRDLHGKSFKFIMTTVLGCADGSRCHSYDTTNAAVKRDRIRHTWKCDNCGSVMNLTTHKHKIMLQNKYKYRPRTARCGFTHTFTYVGVKGRTAPIPSFKIAADNPTDTSKLALTLRRKNKTKLEICRALYNSDSSRQVNINLFVAEAMCTPAGAATYYAKIKKES